MKMQESGEMYLETIYVLSQKQTVVRAVDVANELGYSKPSVSRALGILTELRHVEVADDGAICLTAQGKTYAKSIYERHEVLTTFFESLGVESDVAERDACKIEHILSDKTYLAIKNKLGR